METFKLQTHIGADGVLKVELPTGFSPREVEVVVVLNPVEGELVDELGWPLGFFDRTYGALADDPIERPPQLPLEERDPIE
jgi:hypothetical protein